MLIVLHSQIEEVETVAAACHILYSITHDDAIRGNHFVDVEMQLRKSFATDTSRESLRETDNVDINTEISDSLQKAVCALVMVLQWHAQRRDVTRACIRSITNLSQFSTILKTLSYLGIADPILIAATLHPHARDIVESVVKTIKALERADERRNPRQTFEIAMRNKASATSGAHKFLPFSVSVAGVPGLLLCLKSRPSDLELASIVFRTLAALVGCNGETQVHFMGDATTPRTDKNCAPLSDFAQSQYPEVSPIGFIEFPHL